VPDYLEELGGEGAALSGLRVGIDARYSFEGMDIQISEAVGSVGDVLVAAGATLHNLVVPDVAEASGVWGRIGGPEIALAHQEWFDGNEDQYGLELRALIEGSRGVPATVYVEGCQMRTSFRAKVERVFEEVDLLLCPALGVPLEANTNLGDPEEPLAGLASRFTLPFDVSGSPTVTFPCGFRGGAPIGAQLVAPWLGEATALRAVAAYEALTEWHTRHPEL
jgi:amidase